MFDHVWIIPALPLASAMALAVWGRRLPRAVAGLFGAGSVVLAAAATVTLALQFHFTPPLGHVVRTVLWTWMQVGDFAPRMAFYLDSLAIIMMLVVTVVGALIHIYSLGYMADDKGFSRFFAYMNLFVASMLILVMADNLLLLYLGWEGVGLCSYLLIGFWYGDAANARAASKAFIVTRIGDTAMAIGLFLLFTHLGSLDIQTVLDRATEQWPVGSTLAIAAAALLLGGALGKSGQFPLQVWLPDAMAGPTPVSALIHAATMVTAGVYLVARTHALFTLAPPVQYAVAVIGAATLLIAGFSACAQRDIKRVLAYSTISQIGYMFLALGVGAWSAAIFHLVTHAFFKALLFMGAGMIIVALHHEQDVFKMGGLRTRLPLVFWTFLIGAMSLAAMPLITAGFYSKDLILWDVWSSPQGGKGLWLAGCLGAFLTSIYTFRMVFLTFFGKANKEPHRRLGMFMAFPVVVLAILATMGGFMETPHSLGHATFFSHFAEMSLPSLETPEPSGNEEILLQIIASATALAGVLIAYALFLKRREAMARFVASGFGAMVQKFLLSGCGFDWLYATFLVKPFMAIARANRNDAINRVYDGLAGVCYVMHDGLRLTQNGNLRFYMMGLALGVGIAIAIAVFL